MAKIRVEQMWCRPPETFILVLTVFKQYCMVALKTNEFPASYFLIPHFLKPRKLFSTHVSIYNFISSNMLILLSTDLSSPYIYIYIFIINMYYSQSTIHSAIIIFPFCPTSVFLELQDIIIIIAIKYLALLFL